MRNQCMSLRDFNAEGKIMNKTYDTFFGRNFPKQISSETQGQLEGTMISLWATCFWINPFSPGNFAEKWSRFLATAWI